MLGQSGRSDPVIVGPVLDGQGGRALVRDTDAGAFDGDATYDRTMGPVRLTPDAVAGPRLRRRRRRDPGPVRHRRRQPGAGPAAVLRHRGPEPAARMERGGAAATTPATRTRGRCSRPPMATGNGPETLGNHKRRSITHSTGRAPLSTAHATLQAERVRIREWDPAVAPEAELDAWLRAYNAALAADLPGDPPWGSRRLREYLSVTMPGERRLTWLAEQDDGEVARLRAAAHARGPRRARALRRAAAPPAGRR